MGPDEEILELVTRSCMIEDGIDADLGGTKVHNTGRVAAKFLHSFLDNSDMS